MPIIGAAPSTSSTLATVDDLAVLLQRTFTPAEAAGAELALEIASDAIRTFTRQTLSRVDLDELVLDANGVFELWLPERPVIDVASITIGGSVVSPASYEWNRSGRIRFPAGLGYLGEHGYLVAATQQATIIYSHGFDPMRGDIRGIALDMVMAAVELPGASGVTQEQIGNYSVTFNNQKASTLTAAQERQLLPYRPPTTSAPIVVGGAFA